MPGWYDIVRPRDTVTKPWFNPLPQNMTLTSTKTTFSELAQAHDEAGILKSCEYFNSLIKAETEKGIPSTRIVLGRRFAVAKKLAYIVLIALGSNRRVLPRGRHFHLYRFDLSNETRRHL